MSDRLFNNLHAKAAISIEEFSQIQSFISRRFVKKKKNILNEGDVSKSLIYVDHGCLRSYSIDDSGLEHVVQLAVEDYWIADLYSFVTQTPAILNIEALEDSQALLLHYHDLQHLYVQIPSLEKYFRKLFERAYINNQQRLNATLSLTAEERYMELIQKHPEVAKRVPLIHIASYLGITPESLSRIRKTMYLKH